MSTEPIHLVGFRIPYLERHIHITWIEHRRKW